MTFLQYFYQTVLQRKSPPQLKRLSCCIKSAFLSIVVIFVSACAYQNRYTIEELRHFQSFQATVEKVVNLPGSPTLPTSLSGPDRQIWLKTVQGEIMIIDKVPTSLNGNLCGTIDTLLELEVGKIYTFPDFLGSKPHCTEVYPK
jgi:hypothetical protein